jgi:hypothetical protein
MDTQLVGLAFSPAIKTSICPEILSVAARMKHGRMPASLARSPRLRVIAQKRWTVKSDVEAVSKQDTARTKLGHKGVVDG